MPKLLPDNYRENPIKALWESFNSRDPFYKMFVIIAGLIIGVTPYIVNSYQMISQNAQVAPTPVSVLPTLTPFPTPALTPTPIPVTLGDGILGMYYANTNLSGLPLYRIDQDINFNWVEESPMAGIPKTDYSIRWTGYVAPLHSEVYTFYATSNDGVRVWVNGTQLINGWFDHWSTTFSGSIYLSATRKYSLKVEYYNHQGNEFINLKWSSPSTLESVIPQNQLFTYN